MIIPKTTPPTTNKMRSTSSSCNNNRCKQQKGWLAVLPVLVQQMLMLGVAIYLSLHIPGSFGFSSSSFSTTAIIPRTTLDTSPHRSTTSSSTRTVAVSMSMSTPVIDTPGTDTKKKTKDEKAVKIVKDVNAESEEKSGKDGWEIRLYNDPVNHRTFVAKCLCEICGKTDGQSYQIMMQAHKNGYVVFLYSLRIDVLINELLFVLEFLGSVLEIKNTRIPFCFLSNFFVLNNKFNI